MGRLASVLAQALESGTTDSLGRLFPSDRKVRVSLDRMADLRGFVGAGPLVEAMHRYLSAKADVRFEPEASSGEGNDSGTVHVRGVLRSRDAAGRREKIGLLFVFARIGGQQRAVEVRETG